MFTADDARQIDTPGARKLLAMIQSARQWYPGMWQQFVVNAPRPLVTLILEGLDEWQKTQNGLDQNRQR